MNIKFYREIKKTSLGDISDYFEGNIDNVIASLQRLKDQYKADYNEISIEKDYDYENTTFMLIGVKIETDQEYIKRTDELRAKERARKKEQKKANLERDKAEYERLKKKFEKVDA